MVKVRITSARRMIPEMISTMSEGPSYKLTNFRISVRIAFPVRGWWFTPSCFANLTKMKK